MEGSVLNFQFCYSHPKSINLLCDMFIYTHTHTQSSLPILSLLYANKKTGKELITTPPLTVTVSKRSNQNSGFLILRLLSLLNKTFFSNDHMARQVLKPAVSTWKIIIYF